MRLYTVANTAAINKPVRLTISGKEEKNAIWAFVCGAFVLALTLRTDVKGKPVLMPGNERVATILRYGFGKVEQIA